MLKIIILADAATAKTIMLKLQGLDLKVVAILNPQEYTASIQQKYKADLIISNAHMLTWLTQPEVKNAITPRKQVKAVTHQGIRLVPIEQVYYFQAEHKYVTAYHENGQLLIEDSLNSLANEFAALFIRIHRKTLVAQHKIATLTQGADNHYYVKLHGREEALLVSRRQLPSVRKVLKWL